MDFTAANRFTQNTVSLILVFLVPFPLALLALISGIIALAGKEFVKGLLLFSQVYLFLTSFFFIVQAMVLFFAP